MEGKTHRWQPYPKFTPTALLIAAWVSPGGGFGFGDELVACLVRSFDETFWLILPVNAPLVA